MAFFSLRDSRMRSDQIQAMSRKGLDNLVPQTTYKPWIPEA